MKSDMTSETNININNIEKKKDIYLKCKNYFNDNNRHKKLKEKIDK